MNETSVKSESIDMENLYMNLCRFVDKLNPLSGVEGNQDIKRGGDGILSPKKIVYIEGDFYTPLGYDWVMESICKHIINTDNPFNWTSGNGPKVHGHMIYLPELENPIYRYFSDPLY